MQKEKIQQAVSGLKKTDIDLWMTIGRETIMGTDPILPFISTIDFIGLTAICVTRTGRVIVLVSGGDAEAVRRTNLYDEVVVYKPTFDHGLEALLTELQPKKIALNFSPDDKAADGLSYGLYLRFEKALKNTGIQAEICSSTPIVRTIRGRKTEWEKEKVRQAAITADQIFKDAIPFIKEGVTEIDIYDFFFERMRAYGVAPSWEPVHCPAVFSGPDSVRGHVGPTDIVVKKGHFINIDFGVIQDEYCSDLQRGYYVLKDGESSPPEEVTRAFDTIKKAVLLSVDFMKEGVTGFQVDKIARDYVVSQGYASWDYALGHQVGRAAHDGGTLLAPRFERYNKTELIDTPLDQGNIFTLELGVRIPQGWVGLEEMVFIHKDHAEFLVPLQNEIYLIKPE